MESTTNARVDRARISLEGLATGDAFGETFFRPELRDEDAEIALADPPWHWTDDTAMALSVYEILEKHGCVEQDRLAEAFAARYTNDPRRGYGAGMHRLLRGISGGADWRVKTREQFDGQGSWGNGAAMRIWRRGCRHHMCHRWRDCCPLFRRRLDTCRVAGPKGAPSGMGICSLLLSYRRHGSPRGNIARDGTTSHSAQNARFV
jgi:hypothetical protein